MGCKIFHCVNIHGGQARPCWIRWPFLPVRPLTHLMVSYRLTKMPVEFHCGVTFGVVDLSLPSVLVKLTGMWVPSTIFVQCFRGIKFMAKISPSAAPYSVVLSALVDGPRSTKVFVTINYAFY